MPPVQNRLTDRAVRKPEAGRHTRLRSSRPPRPLSPGPTLGLQSILAALPAQRTPPTLGARPLRRDRRQFSRGPREARRRQEAVASRIDPFELKAQQHRAALRAQEIAQLAEREAGRQEALTVDRRPEAGAAPARAERWGDPAAVVPLRDGGVSHRVWLACKLLLVTGQRRGYARAAR